VNAAVIVRIERAAARGRDKEALVLAEQARAAGLRHPVVFRTLAQGRMTAGALSEAGALLNQALELDRSDPDTLCALGLLLVREGRPDEATPVLAQALKIRPKHPAAWLRLAQALQAEEKDEAALQAFERAVRLQPDDAEPLAGLAEVHFRAGRSELAREAATAALRVRPTEASASLVLARLALRERRPEEALRRANGLLIRRDLSPFERTTSLKVLGDAHDQLGRISDAASAYERMNKETRAFNQAVFGPGGTVEDHLAFMARLERGYRSLEEDWRPGPAESVPSPVHRHIFVLGYPRSGNTLAAAVLGALPQVEVLEERPTLFDADLAFLRREGDLEGLGRLDRGEAARLRELYWERVRAEIPGLAGGSLVDMSPLNGIKLPIIRTLFPQAAVILCRRDPRDVVLSCWRTSFVMNASTYQMTSLEGAAVHFDAAMRLTRACVRMTGRVSLELSYEDLMEDFEAGARALVSAAGLPWSDQALAFAAAAEGRSLRTASAAQVRGGLFDGRGQWRRYAAVLEPVLETLKPWIMDPPLDAADPA
jgi:tetratricopeptide (TPR) repeat protein